MREETLLPAGWGWASIGDVTAASKEKVEPADAGGAPYLGLEHIEANSGQVIGCGDANDVKSTKSTFLADDVLYGKLRPYLNKTCIPGFEGICSTDILVFRRHEYLDNRFLRYVLSSKGCVEFATQRSNGINLPRVSFKVLAEYEFGLPPLNEQRRIVARIEELTARSRRAREALEAVPPLLDKLRQSILAAAFPGRLTADWRKRNKDVEPASELLKRIRTERRQRWEEAELAKLRAKGKEPKNDRWKQKYKEPVPIDPAGLPELPEGWCWISLDEVSWDSQYGTSVKCDYEAPGSPVLRIPNVAGNRLWLEDLKRSVYELSIQDGGELRPGDFLIVRTNGSRDLIGRAAAILVPLSEPSFFASYLIRYRIVGIRGLHQWISLIWQCGAIRRDLERLAATSAGQYNVSLSKLSKIAVPLPPAGEFLELVSRCSTTLESIASESSRVGALLENLERTSESILAKAFRGELVPQDPNDEPAPVLLARIRAQRDAAEAEAKQARQKKKPSRSSRLRDLKNERGSDRNRKDAKSAKKEKEDPMIDPHPS